MQAITVKYLPMTNTKPARVQAIATAGKGPVLSIDAYNDIGDAKRAAAKLLCEKFGWKGRYFEGETFKGETVYVCANPFSGSFNA
jgi:regulator of RNase E activity RraA